MGHPLFQGMKNGPPTFPKIFEGLVGVLVIHLVEANSFSKEHQHGQTSAQGSF